MDPQDGSQPPSPGALRIAEMKEQCGYDEMEESGGVEALIDYKNALEERLVSMIDEAPARRGGH